MNINSNAVYEIAKANQGLASRIEELEGREKKLQELVDYMVEVSDRLCPDEEPDEEPDHLEDGEEVFEHGRGQGIFEMCMKVKQIINPKNRYLTDKGGRKFDRIRSRSGSQSRKTDVHTQGLTGDYLVSTDAGVLLHGTLPGSETPGKNR